MRLGLTMLWLLAPALAIAGAPAPTSNPNSASILLHAHPHAWRPPAGGVSSAVGMTLPDEGGAVAAAAPDVRAAADYRAALASIPVQSRADGSRYAVLGGLVRAYMVASVAPDGRLVRDCVDSQAQALEKIHAASRAATQVDPTCGEN